jgi:PAS domain S-box-containing protein
MLPSRRSSSALVRGVPLTNIHQGFIMRDWTFGRQTFSIAGASAWWKSASAWWKWPVLVACAAATTFFAGATGAAPTLLLSSAVVAFSVSVGGLSAGAVAALVALLATRLTSQVEPMAGMLFIIAVLLISLLVAQLSAAVQKQRRELNAAEARILELQSLVRHGRAIDIALGHLEEVSIDDVLVLLDQEGRITGWRAGAARLYGCTAEDVLGMSGAALFCPAVPDQDFRRFLTEASRHGVARQSGRHRRADRAEFDADVEIRPLAEDGGFAMLTRDRTRRQEWQAFAASAADEGTVLREEAAVAQRQLATLQRVTDPSLNALSAPHLVTVLLDRLREAVEAGGVALVRFDDLDGRVLPATDGLQPRGAVGRGQFAARGLADGRILLIQNDPPRVAESTAVGWSDTVSSLIAVPVLCGGRLEGAIEVVHERGRRSTEWEIALIQVVAARVGVLTAERDSSHARQPTMPRPGRRASDRFVAQNP